MKTSRRRGFTGLAVGAILLAAAACGTTRAASRARTPAASPAATSTAPRAARPAARAPGPRRTPRPADDGAGRTDVAPPATATEPATAAPPTTTRPDADGAARARRTPPPPPPLTFPADRGPPRGASAAARRRWLRRRLDALVAVARARLGPARLGVAVADAVNGRILYERRGDEPFNVASNVKLVTAAAALAILGPDYRFRTQLLAERWDGGDTIAGDLILRGGGDPTLDAAGLAELVAELRMLGIRRVAGTIAIDQGFFDPAVLPPAYEQKDEDGYYRAPVSAVAIEDGAVSVRVRPAPQPGEPARVSVYPGSPYLVVRNGAVTVARGQNALVVRARGVGEGAAARTELTITGTIRHGDVFGDRVRRRIEHPAPYAAATLRVVLEGAGIRVDGEGFRLAAAPTGAITLATRTSEPLAVLIRALGKSSNNHTAELLLKTIGAEAAGTPGTWANGLAAVREWLAGLGLPAPTWRYDNGSGLYDSNRFTPAQLVRLLGVLHRDFRVAPDFVASLAIAGADGTLGRRLLAGAAERYVRAKTGTLLGTVALSGYAGGTRPDVLAFSVVANELPARADAARDGKAFLDAVAETLAIYLDAR